MANTKPKRKNKHQNICTTSEDRMLIRKMKLESEIHEFTEKNKFMIENILEFRHIKQYIQQFDIACLNPFVLICDFQRQKLLFEDIFNHSNSDVLIKSFSFLAKHPQENWQQITQKGSKIGFQILFYFIVYGNKTPHKSQIFSLIKAETFYKNHEYIRAKKSFRQALKEENSEAKNWLIYFIMVRLSLIYNRLNDIEKRKIFLMKSQKISENLNEMGACKSIIDLPIFLEHTIDDFTNDLLFFDAKTSQSFNFEEFEKEKNEFHQKFKKINQKISKESLEISKIYELLDKYSKNISLSEIYFRQALLKA